MTAVEARPPTRPAALDPEIAAATEGFALDLSGLDRSTLPALREAVLALLSSLETAEGAETADRVVPGKPDVTIRIHRPQAPATRPRPCLYWIHGGGYVMGDYRTGDAELTQRCLAFDCVAVSVAYRLAPEHPYPAGLDDCFAGLQWVAGHHAELGIDPARIGLMGPSAGGGLAAGLALRAHDAGGPALAFMALLSPMLDDRQETPSSRRDDAWTWPPAANRFGWQSYLGDLHGGSPPVYAAPGRAEDLAGLPPAFVRVGGVDGFVDEDVLFAQRLQQAGVPTELHVYPGAPHGFETIAPDTNVARRARADLEEWLGRMLG